MIVQGSNTPLAVTFDESIEDIPVLTATLWLKCGSLIKQWDKSDMDISEDGMTIYLSLLEDETANIAPGFIALEIKGLDDSGQTIFWESTDIKVEGRRDKVITLSEYR